MCLWSTHVKERTAKEDMIVYKVLDPDYRSLVREFQYNTHATTFTYRLRKKLHRVPGGAVHHGFHAYTNLMAAKDVRNYYVVPTIIIEVIIPKGAKYYLGDDNDIVSTSIRINEKIRDSYNCL